MAQKPSREWASDKEHHMPSEPFAALTVESNQPITEPEVEKVEERSRPRTPVIYEVVRQLGEEEMDRPAVSLWWSGMAAGLSISLAHSQRR
jgi:hypothetical protein